MMFRLKLLLATAFLLVGAGILNAAREEFPLRAGPFDVVVETSRPEDDLIVSLSNHQNSSEWKGWGGGAYKKIARASSGQTIRFPSGWLYTLSLRGRIDINGVIAHPMYLQEEFYVTTTRIGGTPRRAVCFRSHFSDRDECEYFGLDAVPIIRRKLLTFDEFHLEAAKYVASPDFRYRNMKPAWHTLSVEERAAALTLDALAYCVGNDFRFFQYWNRTPQFNTELDKYRILRTEFMERFSKANLKQGNVAAYAQDDLHAVERSMKDYPASIANGLELYGDKELQDIN